MTLLQSLGGLISNDIQHSQLLTKIKFSVCLRLLSIWRKLLHQLFLISFTEKLRDVFKNVDQLKEDLKNMSGMSTASIDALLETSLPENGSHVSLLSL